MRVLLITECYPYEEKPQYCVFLKQQYDAFNSLGNETEIVVAERCDFNEKLHFVKDATGDRYRFSYKTDRYELLINTYAKKIAKPICEILEKKKYDLICVHITSDYLLSAVIKAGKKYGVLVVQHYHGLNVFSEYKTAHIFRQKFYAFRRAKLLLKTAGLIGVSNKVVNIIREKVKNVPAFTIYNGVNTEAFSKEKIAHNGFNVIGVGNLIEIKGFEYLINAFALFKSSFPNSHLHIIGDGIKKDNLIALANSLNITDSVTFYGNLPYTEVANKLKTSDVFVLPSFYEALGCVYLEAMSSGLPAVGVKGMGIDEIIKDGENGFLVPQKNAEAICEILCRLADNDNLRNEIGNKAVETAENFSWQKSAESLDKAYKEILLNR